MSKYLILVLLMVSFYSNSIEKDKSKHLAVSTLLGFGSGIIINDYRYSLATCISIGLAKEVYDEYDYGGFSKEDLAYDTLGCSIGVFTGEHFKPTIRKDSIFLSFQYSF